MSANTSRSGVSWAGMWSGPRSCVTKYCWGELGRTFLGVGLLKLSSASNIFQISCNEVWPSEDEVKRGWSRTGDKGFWVDKGLVTWLSTELLLTSCGITSCGLAKGSWTLRPEKVKSQSISRSGQRSSTPSFGHSLALLVSQWVCQTVIPYEFRTRLLDAILFHAWGARHCGIFKLLPNPRGHANHSFAFIFLQNLRTRHKLKKDAIPRLLVVSNLGERQKKGRDARSLEKLGDTTREVFKLCVSSASRASTSRLPFRNRMPSLAFCFMITWNKQTKNRKKHKINKKLTIARVARAWYRGNLDFFSSVLFFLCHALGKLQLMRGKLILELFHSTQLTMKILSQLPRCPSHNASTDSEIGWVSWKSTRSNTPAVTWWIQNWV